MNNAFVKTLNQLFNATPKEAIELVYNNDYRVEYKFHYGYSPVQLPDILISDYIHKDNGRAYGEYVPITDNGGELVLFDHTVIHHSGNAWSI